MGLTADVNTIIIYSTENIAMKFNVIVLYLRAIALFCQFVSHVGVCLKLYLYVCVCVCLFECMCVCLSLCVC